MKHVFGVATNATWNENGGESNDYMRTLAHSHKHGKMQGNEF